MNQPCGDPDNQKNEREGDPNELGGDVPSSERLHGYGLSIELKRATERTPSLIKAKPVPFYYAI